MGPTVRLEPVTREQAPVLARLMQLYRYDSGDAIDEHGEFSRGAYFDAYWVEPERCPYFIRVDERLGGFVLIREREPGTWSVAEFFVLRAERRRGVGRRAAVAVFNSRAVRWHVAQEAENTAAQRFWRSVIHDYTDGDFAEGFSEQQPRGPEQTFCSRA